MSLNLIPSEILLFITLCTCSISFIPSGVNTFLFGPSSIRKILHYSIRNFSWWIETFSRKNLHWIIAPVNIPSIIKELILRGLSCSKLSFSHLLSARKGLSSDIHRALPSVSKRRFKIPSPLSPENQISSLENIVFFIFSSLIRFGQMLHSI